MYRLLTVIVSLLALVSVGKDVLGLKRLNFVEEMPFGPGERLEGVLKWSNVPVGTIEGEIRPMTTFEGEPAWRFVLTIKTNGFADKIFKIRDRIESFVAADMSRTLHYRKRQHEGGTKRDITVSFDWDKRFCQYVDKLADPDDPNSIERPVKLKPGTVDELAFLYQFRRLKLKPRTFVKLPVTGGKRYLRGDVEVCRQETIEVGDRTYRAWLLKPRILGLGGVVGETEDPEARLWVTADKHRFPIKMTGKVTVGTFSAEITKITRGKDVEPSEDKAPEAKGSKPAGLVEALPSDRRQ